MAEKIECPVCTQKFLPKEIDVHVNKCIFLNSEVDSSQPIKRSADSVRSPQAVKKVKTESSNPEDNLGGITNIVAVEESPGIKKRPTQPLSEVMRPSDLSQFVGQKHVLGPNKVLLKIFQSEDIPSMILWGPPGCGKTSFAHIIAEKCRKNKSQWKFVKLSATMDGVKDVKEIVKIAESEASIFKRRTVLFMDEIHRFNKLQQDIFLPHVESGLITLIGATTENPSFSLNSALLSRCAVIVLEKLIPDDLKIVLWRAVRELGGQVMDEYCITPPSATCGDARFIIEEASLKWLAEMCDGDARIALNSLQITSQGIINSSSSSSEKSPLISLEDIKDGVKRSHVLYDKKGDEHYNIISALHKSVRAGDANAALYWLARMLEGGEDPLFVARRLVRAASEDIGLADPNALALAVSAMQGCQLIGMPECDVILAQCVVYLSRAPKSREMDTAINKARECVRSHQGPLPSVPLHLRNAPTRLMKDLNYGKGYNMAPKEESGLSYMPDGMEGVTFVDFE
ncbi:ATPase WRNIP1-like [Hetaerina americana]|uniref:ATPase WRNIP1-like n=1 Tax=Hetaerina americana TaxID=62018 RepID=UPI003A7F3D29